MGPFDCNRQMYNDCFNFCVSILCTNNSVLVLRLHNKEFNTGRDKNWLAFITRIISDATQNEAPSPSVAARRKKNTHTNWAPEQHRWRGTFWQYTMASDNVYAKSKHMKKFRQTGNHRSLYWKIAIRYWRFVNLYAAPCNSVRYKLQFAMLLVCAFFSSKSLFLLLLFPFLVPLLMLLLLLLL